MSSSATRGRDVAFSQAFERAFVRPLMLVIGQIVFWLDDTTLRIGRMPRGRQ